MATRWVRAGAVIVVVVALLSGCSPAPEWAIRLNADRTVDFLECWGDAGSVSVDFSRSYQDEPEVIEWEASIGPTPVDEYPEVVERVDVAYYGETPANWEGAPALPPPVGWDYVRVSASWENVAREDLVVGEWQWHLRSTFPWIPDHACDGWEIDAAGEPVRVS